MNEQSRTGNHVQMAESGNEPAYSFHLSLFCEDELYELWLPAIPEGIYSFSDGIASYHLSIEAQNGVWLAVCKKPAFFQDVPLENSYEIALSDGQMLTIDSSEQCYMLYVEQVSNEKMVFHNYKVTSDTELRIGSDCSNDISFNSSFLSRHHAVLSRWNRRWTICDCDSEYGVYVNGKKQHVSELVPGDVISMIGLRIVLGPDIIALSSGDGIVLNPQKLQPLQIGYGGRSGYSGQSEELAGDVFFHRSPRKRIESPNQTIDIEAPPASMDQKQMPMLLKMGSSMVMGGSAALSGNYVTLLTSVLFPFLSSSFTSEQRKEYEQLRSTKYMEYLEQKRREILSACENEKTILNQKYPELRMLLSDIMEHRHLWERRPMDNDFLHVRLGSGNQTLRAEIRYPQRHFSLTEDALENRMYELAEKAYILENVPAVLSLTENYICGFQGRRNLVLSYILKTVAQLAALHSYDELKLVFLASEEDLESMEMVRYLPHVWDDEQTIRLIAASEAEAYYLGEYIRNQTLSETDEQKSFSQLLKSRPYYVIIALDRKLLDGHEVFKSFLQAEINPGASVLAAYENLPKETQTIITLSDTGKSVVTTLHQDGGADRDFVPDYCDVSSIESTMRLLANTRLRAVNQMQTLPKMVTFLEMCGVGRIEQLNPLKRWNDNNPVKSLAAPVGVSADGSVFVLDLHEKRQGPHGLVAGMTGSGKSEFLITYILSMAVNYHPDEVAFVLIDYKGGGLAGAFENPKTGVCLPHLVGTITNLDGSSIRRSLMSIESELLRRQRIFNEVKDMVNEGTMDIYTYQKLYRSGEVDKPMPHLFIISDEFAELKQQQPEFMDKLISAARIGRSLGIHLILATQKPSGVVNDQIRSNTKSRVCLRVQERADSMDMLKRPEAAELTDAGRFYLQVGYNEYFAMGQSAWCGAPYEPQNTVPERRDDEILFLDTTGQTIAKAKPKVRKTTTGVKQIVAVVKYLSELAKSQGIQQSQLWSPPLSNTINLDELKAKYQSDSDEGMSICLGLIDDPERQMQYPLFLPFDLCGNILISGNSGSGKSTFIQNILYSLCIKFSPQDFCFYALDYSSRMLKMFKSLPHCGAVLQEEDAESLDEFFKLINALVAERKKRFSELEVDNFESARKVERVPLVLVIIDHIVGLSTTKIGESHYYKLQNYLQGTANYGIKYIVTCNKLNDVSSKSRQELVERICFHMPDKYDYSDMLGCKVFYTPSENPGRGLTRWNEQSLEFQAGLALADMPEGSRMQKMKEILQLRWERHQLGGGIRRLPVLREDAEYEEFALQFKPGRIPLGFSKKTGKPVALPLKQLSALSIYFGNPKGRIPILKNLIYAGVREKMEIWAVKRKENSIFDDYSALGVTEECRLKCFSLDKSSVYALQRSLAAESTCRNKLIQDYCENQNIGGDVRDRYKQSFHYLTEETTPILLLFESYADFCSSVDFVNAVVFDKILSSAQRWNIYVIGCFEPDDYKRAVNELLYKGFNPDANLLLLGGQYDKQQICSACEVAELKKVLPFNVGLMYYRNEIHSIQIPCGKILNEEVDMDEQSIF